MFAPNPREEAKKGHECSIKEDILGETMSYVLEICTLSYSDYITKM